MNKDYLKLTGASTGFLAAIHLLKPILSPYIKSFGFNSIQLSLFFAIFPLALIFTSVYFGKLSDQVGRMKVISLGIALAVVSIFFYMIGTPWIFIVLARIFNAISVGCVSLITLAKIEDSISFKGRGKFTGWYLTCIWLGRISAPLVGGLIADTFFIKAPFIVAAFMLLSLMFFFIRENKHKIKVKRDHIYILKELKYFLSVKKLKGMGILGIVVFFSHPALEVFLPLLILNKYSLTYSFVGFAIFIFSFTHIFQGVFGNLVDKYGAEKVVMIGVSVKLLGLSFVAFANSYHSLLIILALSGVGSSLWNVSAWSLMSDIGEKSKKEGSITGSYMSLARIGEFISFILSGLIVYYSNIETLFKVVGIIGLIGIIIASMYLTNIINYGKESIRYHWSG